nr:B541 [uncultured bacterium]
MFISTRNRGFTLIELMVALVLGLVVVGGVMGVFMSTYQSNSQNIKAVRLNEEMRAVMSMMTRDIRRAGTRTLAWQPSLLGSDNPFSTAPSAGMWAVSNMSGAEPNSCVRLAYSISNDVGTDAANRFGYRLNTAGEIETYNHTGTWSCGGGGWQPVTDGNIAWVRSLVFTTTTEPGLSGLVDVRTVIVNLRAATHTRSLDPNNATATADCTNIDVVCRQLVEKIRLRNDAVL